MNYIYQQEILGEIVMINNEPIGIFYIHNPIEEKLYHNIFLTCLNKQCEDVFDFPNTGNFDRTKTEDRINFLIEKKNRAIEDMLKRNKKMQLFFLIDSDVLIPHCWYLMKLRNLLVQNHLNILGCWYHTEPILYPGFTNCGLNSDKILESEKEIIEVPYSTDCTLFKREVLERCRFLYNKNGEAIGFANNAKDRFNYKFYVARELQCIHIYEY